VPQELTSLPWYLVSYTAPTGLVYEVTSQDDSTADAVESAGHFLRNFVGLDLADVLGPDGFSVEPPAHLSVTALDATAHSVVVRSAEGTVIGRPMTDPRSPASSWRDPAEAAKWVRALDEVAERLRVDRGVSKRMTVTNGYGSLTAHFGRMAVSVAGADPDVRDEAQLFDYIDRYVAFQLLDSEDQLLDRDRTFMAQWRDQIAEDRRIWEQAAERVFADVDPTLGGFDNWRIELEEDRPVPFRFDDDDPGSEDDDDYDPLLEHQTPNRSYFRVEHRRTPPDWQPPPPTRKRLLLPQLSIRTDECSTSLYRSINTKGTVDLTESVAFLADWLQDDIIEHTETAWPTCPGHEHPLALGGPHDTTWTCPRTDREIAEVGHLRDPRPPAVTA
jgi:hypothetical protein